MSDDDVSDVEVSDEFDDFNPQVDTDVEEDVKEEMPEDEDDVEDLRSHDTQVAQALDSRAIIVVPPEDRLTSNLMTLAEVTWAIAARAKQISTYPNVYTDVGDLSDAKDIARKELYDRRSPLVLRREVGRTAKGESIVELWKVREMTLPTLS